MTTKQSKILEMSVVGVFDFFLYLFVLLQEGAPSPTRHNNGHRRQVIRAPLRILLAGKKGRSVCSCFATL